MEVKLDSTDFMRIKYLSNFCLTAVNIPKKKG